MNKSFRDEMFEINKAINLLKECKLKLLKKIEITPEEVRTFFNKIPEDEDQLLEQNLK